MMNIVYAIITSMTIGHVCWQNKLVCCQNSRYCAIVSLVWVHAVMKIVHAMSLAILMYTGLFWHKNSFDFFLLSQKLIAQKCCHATPFFLST